MGPLGDPFTSCIARYSSGSHQYDLNEAIKDTKVVFGLIQNDLKCSQKFIAITQNDFGEGITS